MFFQVSKGPNKCDKFTRLARSNFGILVRLWHMGDAFRRRSESVSFLRVFCRAGETTGMPLDDPTADIARLIYLRCGKCFSLHSAP